FPSFVAAETLIRGVALAGQGREAEGLAQLRESWTAWQATGAGVMSTWALAALAEALGRAGQADEGLSAAAEGLAFAQTKGNIFRRQTCIGSGGSGGSCSRRPSRRRRPRRKPASAKPSRLPAASKRSPGSCGP